MQPSKCFQPYQQGALPAAADRENHFTRYQKSTSRCDSHKFHLRHMVYCILFFVGLLLVLSLQVSEFELLLIHGSIDQSILIDGLISYSVGGFSTRLN